MAWTSGMPTIVPGPFSRQQPRRMRCAVHGQTCAPGMLDLVLPGNLVRRRGDADDERRIHRFCQLDLRRFDRRAVPLSEDLSAAGRGGGWRLDRLLRAKADHRTTQRHRPASVLRHRTRQEGRPGPRPRRPLLRADDRLYGIRPTRTFSRCIGLPGVETPARGQPNEQGRLWACCARASS